MIGYLKGVVGAVSEKEIIVLTGGVGYRVLSPLPLLLSKVPGSEIELHIHTHVREDQLALFGFEQKSELEVFEHLINVSGIGPKSALGMLSVHSPASIADAVEQGDAQALSHSPGIGKKTAEKIILELKGKLSRFQDASKPDALFEVRLALEALGYSSKEIHDVLQKVDANQPSTSLLIKDALSKMK